MGYLICDDLTTPIEEALSKDRIEVIFANKNLENKGKVYMCGFTANINDCPIFKANISEVPE